MPASEWFLNTILGEKCNDTEHCEDCDPFGDCDPCHTMNGRVVEEVCCYADTCDWCAELTHNAEKHMDPKTQFAYCENCFQNKIPQEIRDRIIKHESLAA